MASVHLSHSTPGTPLYLTIYQGYQESYFGGSISGTGPLTFGGGYGMGTTSHYTSQQVLGRSINTTGRITVKEGEQLVLTATTALQDAARQIAVQGGGGWCCNMPKACKSTLTSAPTEVSSREPAPSTPSVAREPDH